MYNKYFTMKRSELKEAIKNEITSVLSEEELEKFQMTYIRDKRRDRCQSLLVYLACFLA